MVRVVKDHDPSFHNALLSKAQEVQEVLDDDEERVQDDSDDYEEVIVIVLNDKDRHENSYLEI